MKICVIVVALCLVALIAVAVGWRYKTNREGMSLDENDDAKPFYGRPGVRSIPLYIPIPKNPEMNGQTYVDYHHPDWKKYCPSPAGTRCRNYSDCGPAELCIDQAGYIVRDAPEIQPESAVCVCSIQNSCALEGNIC
jgi:hypothetical protein